MTDVLIYLGTVLSILMIRESMNLSLIQIMTAKLKLTAGLFLKGLTGKNTGPVLTMCVPGKDQSA
jgi:hypothetical protein